jgi:hypothetical protein
LGVRVKGVLLMENEMRKKMFVKLYYSLLDWAWISDPNTLVVFIHLLLNANRKDKPYRNDVIRKGEVLASYEFLSEKTGLSVQKIRRAVKNLIETGDISHRIVAKTNVFAVSCWNNMENCFVDYNNSESYSEHKKQHGKNIEKTSQNQENITQITSGQHQTNIKTTTPIYCKNEENERLKECESVTDAHAHGKLNNVFISQDEFESFRKDFPSTADKVIDQLSEKIATGEKKYQTGHLGHLYVFARNYKEEKKAQPETKPSYDIELALKKARNLDPTKTKRKQ